MKKKHLHKATHIAQEVDEPEEDDPDVNNCNEKGTFTDEEYLKLKPSERTILLSVMEEQLEHTSA